MATTSFYNKYFEQLHLGQFDWSTASAGYAKVLLVTSGYTFDRDTHDFRDDITNEVAAGGGYTAGGENLTNLAVTEDDVNDRSEVDFDDPEWPSSTITARGAVFYKNVGTAATDILVAFLDFEADFSSSSSTFRIELDAEGFMALREAP
jgi:hypothetical protein